MVMGLLGLASTGVSALARGASKKGGLFGQKPRKRRRRARLTAGDITELSQIKAVLGKTAAANALPFYMGRGRG